MELVHQYRSPKRRMQISACKNFLQNVVNINFENNSRTCHRNRTGLQGLELLNGGSEKTNQFRNVTSILAHKLAIIKIKQKQFAVIVMNYLVSKTCRLVCNKKICFMRNVPIAVVGFLCTFIHYLSFFFCLSVSFFFRDKQKDESIVTQIQTNPV